MNTSRHKVVDAFDPGGVGEEVHDEVAEVAAVGRGHDLHGGLQVLALDGQERVAGQCWKKDSEINIELKVLAIDSFLFDSFPRKGSSYRLCQTWIETNVWLSVCIGRNFLSVDALCRFKPVRILRID